MNKKSFIFTFAFLVAMSLFSCKPDNEPETSKLPKIFIETENNAEVVSKESWLNATFTFEDETGKYPNLNAVETQIRGRGNATWNLPKKPYRLRFPSSNLVPLFGLTPARNWVLLAFYQDVTFLVNPIGYELSRRLANDNSFFSHHSFHIELYMNGVYQGIYMVTEHNEIAPGRVDIPADNNSLLIEIDQYFDEPYKFKSDVLSLPVMIKHPESDYGVESAKTIINELEALLFTDDYLNNWNAITDIVDINSLINYTPFTYTRKDLIPTYFQGYSYTNGY